MKISNKLDQYRFCHPRYLQPFTTFDGSDYVTEKLTIALFLKIMCNQKVFEKYYNFRPYYLVWEITHDGNDPIPF